MNLRDLRYLIAVAEHRHFGRAAEACAVSQPTLSTQLKKLEAYLGVTLIAGREAHHLAFTEAEEDWQLWVSTDETAPLPLMLVGTEKNETGWPQYLVYMMDWNLAPEIDASAFRYTPREVDVRVGFPALFGPPKPEDNTAPAATGQ